MKNLLKRLFFKPALTITDLLIIVLVNMTATPIYNYSGLLYLVFFIFAVASLLTSGKITDNYFEVVENEFEKDGKQ